MNQQAEQVGLDAEKRAVLGRQVKQLRRDGLVPGVMYGHGFDPVHLQFAERSLTTLLSHVGGSQLVSIKIKGQKEPQMALVRDVQRDPIRGTVLHVDFYHVTMTERLRAEIPLLLEGESPALAANEGILLQGISTIEVECLPGDLVDAIEVDLSELTEVGHSVQVADLAIPAGIDVLTDPEEMVAWVTAMAEEEVIEEEEALELELGELEGLEEGEVEGEGEEAAAEEEE